MQMYSCKVRLRGDLYNEVRKEAVSAPEVKILQFLHGGEDSVVDTAAAGKSDISDAGERERLRMIYSATADGSMTEGRVDLVRHLFGPDTIPLPQQLEGIDHPDVVTTERQRRTRVARPAEAPEVDASAELMG